VLRSAIRGWSNSSYRTKGHSVLVTPLHARGLTLGGISVWRCGRSEPFTEETDLMKQIASRGALAIDNARRYTREHRAAVALQ
jgi:GAF domain-containing protein